jgi:putative NADPH-quinone reductase
MKVLVIYAHPLDDSFNAAIHRTVVESLATAGHEVDDLDLYAENFQPVLSREERRNYHDEKLNRAVIGPYIDRLQRADAVVFVFPTWSFGVPAILKGWFDRVLIPGVSFTFNEDGSARQVLKNVRRIAAVSTYGRPWWLVRLVVGDIPRRQITRHFRLICGGVPTTYLAYYNMNQATPAKLGAFLDKVRRVMTRL